LKKAKNTYRHRHRHTYNRHAELPAMNTQKLYAAKWKWEIKNPGLVVTEKKPPQSERRF
jgi:hypothetical protein